jgi:hypothetical protein
MPHPRADAETAPWAVSLYRVGSLSVLLFILLGRLAPMAILNSVDYDTELAGAPLRQFIGDHRLWWIWLQTLTMDSMVFLIVPLMALFPALMHVDAAWPAIGVIFAIACQVPLMAYFPVVNGLVWLADRYAEAFDPTARAALSGGAEALVARNNAYGTSDGIFALGFAVLSILMRRGPFPAWLAWIGILSGLAGIVGAFLKPALGIHYLWWWLGVMVWIAGIGWRFRRLGWPRGPARA